MNLINLDRKKKSVLHDHGIPEKVTQCDLITKVRKKRKKERKKNGFLWFHITQSPLRREGHQNLKFVSAYLFHSCTLNHLLIYTKNKS